MARQKQLSLASVDFNPTPFQAVTFTPQAADVSLLANSLAKQEEREQKATEAIAKGNEVFANIRSKLHQDSKTMARFAEMRDATMDRLYNLRNLDPDRAIKEGILLGSETIDDAELQGMMRNNEELNAETKRIQERRDLDDITKRRFIKQNEEAFESIPQLNDKGEVIGTHKWKPISEPVADINPLDLAVLVSKIVAPHEESTTKQRHGKTVKADSSAKEYTTVDGKTIHVLSADRLQDVYDKVEESYPGYFQALTQNYENQFFRLDEIEEQLLTATGHTRVALEDEKRRIKKELYTEDGLGVQRTPEEYRDYQLGVVLDNMSYENTDIKDVNEWGRAAAQEGSGSGSFGGAGITGWPFGFGNATFTPRVAGTVNMNFGKYGLGASSSLYGGIGRTRTILTLNKGDVIQYNGQWFGSDGQPIAQPGGTN